MAAGVRRQPAEEARRDDLCFKKRDFCNAQKACKIGPAASQNSVARFQGLEREELSTKSERTEVGGYTKGSPPRNAQAKSKEGVES